jgi:PilZ domain
MFDYSEKRDFLRMTVDCPGRYRAPGADQVRPAVVRNLSATGVLLLTEEPVAADAELALEIMPGKTITPPLAAFVKVLRCDAGEDGRYTLACAMMRILDESEHGPGFP